MCTVYDDSGRTLEERHPWQAPDGSVKYSTTRHYWRTANLATPDELAPWGSNYAVSAHVLVGDDGARTVTAADARGNAVNTVDPYNLVTSFVRGAFDHVKSVNVGSTVTAYATDDAGNVIHVQDPDTGSHEYHYDGSGLLRKHIQGSRTFNCDPGTKMSGPLLETVEAGAINRRFIP